MDQVSGSNDTVAVLVCGAETVDSVWKNKVGSTGCENEVLLDFQGAKTALE